MHGGQSPKCSITNCELHTLEEVHRDHILVEVQLVCSAGRCGQEGGMGEEGDHSPLLGRERNLVLYHVP